MKDYEDLLRRLRGIYVIPVTDGGGPLNGKETYTRTFDVEGFHQEVYPTPPIYEEAAHAIEELLAERGEE